MHNVKQIFESKGTYRSKVVKALHYVDNQEAIHDGRCSQASGLWMLIWTESTISIYSFHLPLFTTSTECMILLITMLNDLHSMPKRQIFSHSCCSCPTSFAFNRPRPQFSSYQGEVRDHVNVPAFPTNNRLDTWRQHIHRWRASVCALLVPG